MKRSAPKRSTTPIARRTRPPKARARIKVRRVSKRFAKHRDPGLRAFVKKWWGCWVCQKRPVDPAHVEKRSRGSDDRNNVLPLCREHHDEQEGRNAAFEKKYRVNLAAAARAVTKVYDSVGPEPSETA